MPGHVIGTEVQTWKERESESGNDVQDVKWSKRANMCLTSSARMKLT